MLPIPRMINSGKIFSNEISNSGATTLITNKPIKGRYNTEFIDTRVRHAGETWYTTVRVMAVGSKIIHAYPRAGASPNVHSKDIPQKPDLIEYLHQHLVINRWNEIASLTSELGDTLGPGFYAHDLLIGEKIYVCETGFKFDDTTYARRLRSIQNLIPSQHLIYNGEFYRKSADAFIESLEKQ